MKLYELTEQYNRLLEAIDNGEIPEEAIADTLEMVEGELKDKAESIACMIKDFKADVDALKAEEEKLHERRSVKENAIDRLKAYLDGELKKACIDKMETSRAVLSYRTSKKVVVSDEVLIKQSHPECIVITEKISLSKIKEAIEKGEQVAGATIETIKNLQIK